MSASHQQAFITHLNHTWKCCPRCWVTDYKRTNVNPDFLMWCESLFGQSQHILKKKKKDKPSKPTGFIYKFIYTPCRNGVPFPPIKAVYAIILHLMGDHWGWGCHLVQNATRCHSRSLRLPAAQPSIPHWIIFLSGPVPVAHSSQSEPWTGKDKMFSSSDLLSCCPWHPRPTSFIHWLKKNNQGLIISQTLGQAMMK